MRSRQLLLLFFLHLNIIHPPPPEQMISPPSPPPPPSTTIAPKEVEPRPLSPATVARPYPSVSPTAPVSPSPGGAPYDHMPSRPHNTCPFRAKPDFSCFFPCIILCKISKFNFNVCLKLTFFFTYNSYSFKFSFVCHFYTFS